jgi:hypothetical protein
MERGELGPTRQGERERHRSLAVRFQFRGSTRGDEPSRFLVEPVVEFGEEMARDGGGVRAAECRRGSFRCLVDGPRVSVARAK